MFFRALLAYLSFTQTHGMGIPYHRNMAEDCDPDLVQDHRVRFHGIGFDVTRLENILEYGILAEAESKERRNGYFVRNIQGHANRVNVVTHPNRHVMRINGFESHVEDAIALIISPEVNLRSPERDRSSMDHFSVDGSVEPDQILGIMVPERMIDGRLSDLSLGFASMARSFIVIRVKAILQYLRNRHGYEVPPEDPVSILLSNPDADALTEMLRRNEARSYLEKWTARHIESAYAKSFGMRTVTLKQALNRIASEAEKCVTHERVQYARRVGPMRIPPSDVIPPSPREETGPEESTEQISLDDTLAND